MHAAPSEARGDGADAVLAPADLDVVVAEALEVAPRRRIAAAPVVRIAAQVHVERLDDVGEDQPERRRARGEARERHRRGALQHASERRNADRHHSP